MKTFLARRSRLALLVVGVLTFAMAVASPSPRCTCGHSRMKHTLDYRPRYGLGLDGVYGECRVAGCDCWDFHYQNKPITPSIPKFVKAISALTVREVKELVDDIRRDLLSEANK